MIVLDKIRALIQSSGVKKTAALILLVAAIYLFNDMVHILLLTFIFSFLFYSACSWLMNLTNHWIKLSERVIVTFVYCGFVVIIWIVSYLFAPVIIKEVLDIANLIAHFDLDNYKETIHPRVFELIREVNIDAYVKEAVNQLMRMTKDVGKFLLNIFISLILSFIFVWERKDIMKFLERIKFSKVAFLYEYYAYFARNFSNTFGKVIQLQIVISFINSVLSAIMLYILGFHQLLGLSVMIFVLGLIPVAGVVISLLPLSIIAFQLGGWVKVLHVLIMIIIVHSIESYLLNPKLMSVKMKLPVFFSFSVLITFEHLFGVWGLLVGIPLFMFLLDIIGASPEIPKEHK